jgi:G3E family GTPase
MSIPITIVGGYLGAGKTSLINHVLSGKHGRRVTVLVNDFGSINIDASLIADQADDTISLTNGCACCAIQDDLGAALQVQIERAVPPDHILIEMSGVAEPSRIRRYAEAWPGVHLDAIVTLADAETVRAQVDDKFVGRVVRRQLAAADCLVLNKVDLVSETERAQTTAWLQDHCPDSRVLEATHGAVDAALLFEPKLRPFAKSDLVLGDRAATLFCTDVVALPEPVSRVRLEAALAQMPNSIHRIKGFFTDRVTRRRMLVHVVGRRASMSQAPNTATASPDVLIVIGTDRIEIDAARALLSSLFQPDTAASA